LGSRGTSIRQKKLKNTNEHTFDHLGGRNGVISTLLVTGCIVKHEELLSKAICLVLKDINCMINLGDEFSCTKVSTMVLPWFEHKASLSAE